MAWEFGIDGVDGTACRIDCVLLLFDLGLLGSGERVGEGVGVLWGSGERWLRWSVGLRRQGVGGLMTDR